MIQDIEGGYSTAWRSWLPGGWLLPLCELALMTDGRAYDINVELDTTVITGRTARWRSGP